MTYNDKLKSALKAGYMNNKETLSRLLKNTPDKDKRNELKKQWVEGQMRRESEENMC